MELLSLMFGSSGSALLNATLLIGLFWAALAHPDRIRSLVEFRIATVLLGFAMVLPAFIQFLFVGSATTGLMSPTSSSMSEWSNWPVVISPVLSMLALILGLNSVTPVRAVR